MDLISLAPVYPELMVALGAVALLMLGAFMRDGEAAGRSPSWLALAVIAAAFVLVLNQTGAREVLFDGAFVNDGVTRFLELLILMGSGLALLLTFNDFARTKIPVLRISGAAAHRHARNADDGVGKRPHCALSGARVAKSGALCRRRLQA